MLKISIVDTPSHRRLVVEGKLVAPWAAELRSVWQEATADLNGRELVVDVKDLTAISEDGENVLLELMKEGAHFRSSGVFTKQVLKRLARQIRTSESRTSRGPVDTEGSRAIADVDQRNLRPTSGRGVEE